MQWQGSTPEVTERLNKHKVLLPETLLQRGVSNLGELTRVEAALQKLASGTPPPTPHPPFPLPSHAPFCPSPSV